jgi:type III pantothenate kinase
MVSRFRAELGPDMKCVGTGSFVELIAKETKSIDVVEPWLTLEGLKVIYELNRSARS